MGSLHTSLHYSADVCGGFVSLVFRRFLFFFNVTILSRDISCPYRIKLHKTLKRSKVKSSFHLLMAVGVLSWLSGGQNFTYYFFLDIASSIDGISY